MQSIGMAWPVNGRRLCAALLAVVLVSGGPALAQTSDARAIDQAQRAVRQQIANREGGGNLTVLFGSDARTQFPSNTTVLVSGTGNVVRSNDGKTRPFSYEAVVNTRNNSVSDLQYDWRGDWYAGTGRRGVTNGLTGMYRLNPSRSDDPAATADSVARNSPQGQQQRLRDSVIRRLQAPESLAIRRDGNTITMASSIARQVTFQADGREQTEQSRNGRQVRTTARLSGEQLVVSTQGDRSNDYEVTFEPIDNGRSLRVTRRVTQENVKKAVVARSVYDKIANTPNFDIASSVRGGSPSTYTPTPTQSYGVPDGTELLAVLDDDLSTEQANNGDRVTWTVRSPSPYAGASLEGVLVGVARSGKLSGRAEMSFQFNSIRLSNGRVSSFDGYIESVSTTEGDTVTVDTEGRVQDEGSQTTRTVASTGIGAAIGAVIGAVTGGGKGAAIGAAVGAGAGAGSVFIQGRNDLELKRGTEFRIRAGTYD